MVFAGGFKMSVWTTIGRPKRRISMFFAVGNQYKMLCFGILPINTSGASYGG